jgi:histidine ammonia-lyase
VQAPGFPSLRLPARNIQAKGINTEMESHSGETAGALRIDGSALAIDEVVAVARRDRSAYLEAGTAERLRSGRRLIDTIVESGTTVYGINTGFGSLATVRISREQLLDLQRNLVRSHAAGVGDPLDREMTRAMIVITAASLARGHSGVRPELVQSLLSVLNAGIVPVVPSQGSVGASGDLAPLAHIALVVIGEGEAIFEGRRMPGAEALRRAGLAPQTLQAKEGLALINGTHLMCAAGALAVHDADRLILAAETAAGASLDALKGTDVALDDRIHRLRPHAGQLATAERLRGLLRGSEIRRSHAGCTRVQDPYSLRCIPQVLGAVRDAVAYCRQVIAVELGAVTDNPLSFPDDGVVLSGGNFHGQPLALALDFLAMAITQLSSFSERRTYALLSTWEGEAALPVFLTETPGLGSGFMVAQYVAAALVNENKVLSHPASVDSIPTSAGTEDFNSMGATSAWKARRVLANAEKTVAIEALCAMQAVECLRPLRSGDRIEEALGRVRAVVPRLLEDRPLSSDIEVLARGIRDGMLAV